jgi:hypothetical protein
MCVVFPIAYSSLCPIVGGALQTGFDVRRWVAVKVAWQDPLNHDDPMCAHNEHVCVPAVGHPIDTSAEVSNKVAELGVNLDRVDGAGKRRKLNLCVTGAGCNFERVSHDHFVLIVRMQGVTTGQRAGGQGQKREYAYELHSGWCSKLVD